MSADSRDESIIPLEGCGVETSAEPGGTPTPTITLIPTVTLSPTPMSTPTATSTLNPTEIEATNIAYLLQQTETAVALTPTGTATPVQGTLTPDRYCVSIAVVGVNVRADPYPTADILEYIGSPATEYQPSDPWRLRLVGYIDVPEIGRYYWVEGVYQHGDINRLDEEITGWLSEQITSGPVCDSSIFPNLADMNLPVLVSVNPPPMTVGTATFTPNPPPTSTPPPDLSDVFPLPMLHENDIRLSRCGLHRDGNPSLGRRGDLVLGLDMNPVGGAGLSHPLIIPARAQVVAVDTQIDLGQEIGNFVAIRIEMQDLPLEIRARLDGTAPAENGREIQYNQAPADTRYQTISPATVGAIYIGYGHLGSVAPIVEIGAILEAGTVIGTSGDTGVDWEGTPAPHLHVAVFYAEDSPKRLIPEWVPDTFSNNFQWYYTAYDLGRNPNHTSYFGNTYLINPLVLWPSSQEGTQCTYWKILQLVEG